MIRTGARLALILALLGCGATPAPPPPAPIIEAVPRAALTLWVQPRALLDGLDAVHARMGGALGPVSEAWSRVEQQISDAVSALLPSRSTQPTLLAEWGIDGARPMRLSLAAPHANAMAKALLQRLSGATPTLPDAVAHGRVELGVTDASRVIEALGVLTARVGLDAHRVGKGRRPAWIGAEPLPPTLRWLGRDPETGTWAALRVWPGDDRGRARATFDVLLPPKPGPIAALVAALARSAPTRAAADAPLVLQMRPAEMALLETAGAGLMGLRYGQAGIGEAVAEVLTACIARWRASGEHAASIEATLAFDDGRPALTAAAHLTPLGQAAWVRAERPAPRLVWGLAAWRMGWHSGSFGAVDPEWIAETAQCVVGRPWTAALAALPILPRVLPPRAMPLPPMLVAMPWTRVDAAAAAIVDVATLDGEATPVMTGVFQGEGPRPAAPTEAEMVEVVRDGETRWRAIDAPVEIGYRPGQLRVGLGPDALRAVAPPTAAVAFEAVIDAAALADRLKAAGEPTAEVRALAAVGERFGRLSATLRRSDETVHLQVSFKARPPNP